MTKKADVTYKIEITFGSDRQRELHLPIWNGIIGMLADRIIEGHKKNIIKVEKSFSNFEEKQGIKS